MSISTTAGGFTPANLDSSSRQITPQLHGLIAADVWDAMPDTDRRCAIAEAGIAVEARAIRALTRMIEVRLDRLAGFVEQCRPIVGDERADELVEVTGEAVGELYEDGIFARLLDPIAAEADRHVKDIIGQQMPPMALA